MRENRTEPLTLRLSLKIRRGKAYFLMQTIDERAENLIAKTETTVK